MGSDDERADTIQLGDDEPPRLQIPDRVRRLRRFVPSRAGVAMILLASLVAGGLVASAVFVSRWPDTAPRTSAADFHGLPADQAACFEFAMTYRRLATMIDATNESSSGPTDLASVRTLRYVLTETTAIRARYNEGAGQVIAPLDEVVTSARSGIAKVRAGEPDAFDPVADASGAVFASCSRYADFDASDAEPR